MTTTPLDDMLATAVADHAIAQTDCDYAQYYSTQVHSVMDATIADNQTMSDVLALLQAIVTQLDPTAAS